MASGKIITTLEHRPEIESALRSLAQARTEKESEQYLQSLARYGLQVLPILTLYLDTPDPWMVRALGRAISQIEDREGAVQALRRAVLSPDSSDRRRIVAMVLLDQFLDYALDNDLYNALGNPTDVAVRALLQDPPVEDRMMRLDYLSIIHAQPPAEIEYALGRFREAGNEEAIEALSFMALDERDKVALPAIEALGTIRRTMSLHMLDVLEFNVPAARKPLLERTRRKLFLSGVETPPLREPPPGTRVLVSPSDGAGNRLLLFLFPDGEEIRGLHVFLDDERGVRGVYEAILPKEQIPPPAGIGQVHPAPHPWEGVFFLEGTFPYAHRILQDALHLNELRGGRQPLEYRFFCDQIWGWSVPSEDSPLLPAPRAQVSQQEVADLLGHAYLSSWFLQGDELLETASKLLTVDLSKSDGQGFLALLTVTLIQSEFSAFVCMQYIRRLRVLAEWLVLAGETALAQTAITSAAELDATSPLRSTFALMLTQRSLLIVLGNLRLEKESEEQKVREEGE